MDRNQKKAAQIEEMTGAEMVLRAFKDHGVRHIFGYPGGAVLPIYDALYNETGLEHILVRHEQGATHAAEGYARSTGKPGVVIVTSGPGATNAVTGIADALLDSVPLVVITGQVATPLIGTDAFQECDTVGITRPCTKHNWLVKDIKDLPRILHEAFYVATSGRPGPVVVDLPKDIQFARGTYVGPENIVHRTYHPDTDPDPAAISEAVEMMAAAKRPVFYTGGGIINSGDAAVAAMRELVKITNFPITSTLTGLGVYPGSGPNWLGMVGMHGTFESNNAMHDCDLMICLGARFDDRVTGRLSAFAPYARKIHLDVDASQINKNVAVDLPVVGDAGKAISAMVKEWKAKKCSADAHALADWWRQIDRWRAKNSLNFHNSDTVIKPQYALDRLYEKTKSRDTYITTEVGQHQMWAAQRYRFEEPKRLMTSGGLGTMGYGLPAAVGVQVAHPDALVIDIAGEGSVQMTMQEINTAAQYHLPIKIFILNNGYLGMVRQWQELLHGERYSQSKTTVQPDFVKLAEALGGTGIRVQNPADLDAAIDKMMATNGPVIMDVIVDEMENCYPMIPSGAAHNEMILSDADEEVTEVSDAGKALV